jgi:hypothetical protein
MHETPSTPAPDRGALPTPGALPGPVFGAVPLVELSALIDGNPWRMAPATPDQGTPGTAPGDPMAGTVYAREPWWRDATVQGAPLVGTVQGADPWDRCPGCGCTNYDRPDQDTAPAPAPWVPRVPVARACERAACPQCGYCIRAPHNCDQHGACYC